MKKFEILTKHKQPMVDFLKERNLLRTIVNYYLGVSEIIRRSSQEDRK